MATNPSPVTAAATLITAPAAAVLTPEQQIQAVLVSQLSALAHKHATVSYGLIAVLVVFLALAGLGGYFGLKLYDKEIARAEAANQRYEQDKKELATELATNTAQRATDTQQQGVIVKVVHDTDSSTDAKIAQVLQPKTPQEALSDLDSAYSGSLDLKNTPVDPAGSTLTFSIPTVQQFSATKLDRNRLSADLSNYQGLLKLEQDKTTTLTADLKKSGDTLGTCQTTVDDYKKAAKVGKFKKFLHGAGVTTVAIVAAVVGYEIGHKL